MPAKPLNIDVEWHTSIRNPDNSISMSKVECDKFASKTENICDMLGYCKRQRAENVQKIKNYVNIAN